MAKVSLRIYNREIESLIDQGHLDEAVAHCRHILQTFPKHLETYRLLGKAYLEAKRYEEAVDVFSRILMAVPDDFVSHVGMSIIRDEQNKLDDAIWHMERGFEAQPANAAIQAELQRLYGRRDGVEPPKIRMTRGALAHMYVQGELYPQAISEIRAVLAADPLRADMEVLLARAFFRGGQKADASDMCAQLLKRYPYCFDANRIMVELLPASGRAENTQVYRHRVNELDPYTTFSKESVFRSAEVPDASINLDRLEYKGQEVEVGRDWNTSLGIGLAGSAASAEQPEWLRTDVSDQGVDSQAESSLDASGLEPESASSGDANIPDFMRDAGWTESSGAGEDSSFDASASEESLTPANIPDWLKGQMPSEPPMAGIGERPTAPPADLPDLFAGPGSPDSASASTDIPDWLSGLGSDQPAESAAAPSEEMPDWLKSLGAADAEQPSKEEGSFMAEESVPDWLSPPPTPMEEKEPEPVTSEPKTEPIKPPAPASIETLGASSKEQDDAIAWLEMLAAKHGAKPEELVTDPAARSEQPPEWVEQARALAESQPPAEAAEETRQLDETGIWLRDLSKQESPEEVVKKEEVHASDAEVPDWLKGLDTEQEQPPVQETNQLDWRTLQKDLPRTQPLDEEALTNLADVPDWMIGMEEEPQEAEAQKDVGEWLKGLDQESKPEEEPSAEEPANLPDWLSGLDKPESVSQAEPAEKEREVPGWLGELESSKVSGVEEEEPAEEESLPLPAQTEEPAPAEATPAELPDWLRGIEQSEETESQVKAEEESFSPLAETEEPAPVEAAPADLPDWLRGIEQSEETEVEAKTEEEALAPLAEIEEPAPAEAIPADLPDWLRGIEQSEETEVEAKTEEEALTPLAEIEEPAPAEAAPADLPEWLRGLEQGKEAEAEAKPEETPGGIPAWLKTDFEEEEEPHPAPVTPADWHPAEPRREPPTPQSEPGLETPQPALRDVSSLAEGQPTPPPPDVRKPEPPRIPEPTPARPARSKSLEGLQTSAAVLTQAQTALSRGDIPGSLASYNKLIKKGKHLDEAIRDLRESLYRYPVEVGIWQTLGDAYMRANRLQEALDAYNKAEELLR